MLDLLVAMLRLLANQTFQSKLESKKYFITTPSVEKSKQQEMKLYDNLKKDEVVNELHQRGVKFSCDEQSKDLHALLVAEMHGIQRVPALFILNPLLDITKSPLHRYEIMFTEPLHDISNHIKNFYQELPLQVQKTEKKTILDVITMSFNGKELKNSSDYRRSLMIVTKWFLENRHGHFLTEILLSLSEIQELLYLKENLRSIVSVIRLHTITLKHAMLLKINLRSNLKS